MTHIGQQQVEAYWKGTLPLPELVRLDEHIESCELCRTLLFDAAPSSLIPTEAHLSYEDLETWVNQSAPAGQRQQVEAHLAACPACRAEADDLQRFRQQLQRTKPRAWMKPAAVAAAILVAVIAVWQFRPDVSPSLTIALRDNGRTVGLDSTGRLIGFESLHPAASARLTNLLRGGEWNIQTPVGLSTAPTSFLGPGGSPSAFHLTSPLGKVIVEDRPVFSWSSLPGAMYRVHITDDQFQPVVESEPLRQPNWQPSQPLPRAKVLIWQVAATRGTETTRVPQPPQPEARFLIAASELAMRITEAQARTPLSRLELAALYSDAGMLEECERELQLLAGENKESSLPKAWLAGIRGAR